MKVRVGVAAILMSLMSIDQALAGFFKIVPTPPPTPAPVPELDGPGSITVIALLACVGAILFNRYRKR